jgi:parallel beta-helix repeat protein
MITVSKKTPYFIMLIILGAFVYNALKLFKANGNKFYISSKPITLNGVHNKVISNLDIKGDKADCIKLTNCYNITIKDCRLRSSKKNGADIVNSKNITIINCYFENTKTGVYAYQSESIKITHNQFKNMQGPLPKGQMVQFNEVYGKGNKVNFNKCQNDLGAGNPEDVINMYKTNGTINDPVQIIGNQICGGGPSKTGGGIMLGDNGGSYMTVKDNILVDPGQYGIAIAGGTNIQIIRNKIFGRQQLFTNVGIYIWNQHTTGCALNTITNNKVNFTNSYGEANHSWNSGNCGKVTGWETNAWGAKIDEKILPANIISQ